MQARRRRAHKEQNENNTRCFLNISSVHNLKNRTDSVTLTSSLTYTLIQYKSRMVPKKLPIFQGDSFHPKLQLTVDLSFNFFYLCNFPTSTFDVGGRQQHHCRYWCSYSGIYISSCQFALLVFAVVVFCIYCPKDYISSSQREDIMAIKITSHQQDGDHSLLSHLAIGKTKTVWCVASSIRKIATSLLYNFLYIALNPTNVHAQYAISRTM